MLIKHFQTLIDFTSNFKSSSFLLYLSSSFILRGIISWNTTLTERYTALALRVLTTAPLPSDFENVVLVAKKNMSLMSACNEVLEFQKYLNKHICKALIVYFYCITLL